MTDYQSDLSAIGMNANAEISILKAQVVSLQTELASTKAKSAADIALLNAEIARLNAIINGTPPPVDPPPVDPPPVTPPTGLAKLKRRPPTMTSPVTIKPADNVGTIKLSAGQDAIIELPKTRAWKNPKGLDVSGGRNVTCIGGTVDVGGGFYNSGTGPGVPGDHMVKRAACFLGVTGTIHLEGVAFTSSTGDLSEGINYSSASAIAVIQHCKHLVPLKGDKATNHADAIQGWNGPKFLYVDNFYAETTYQGMFLNPNDTGSGPVDNNWELHNVEIVGLAGAKYILWVTSPPAKVITDNVYTSGGLGNWDSANDWPGVKHGVRAPVKYAPTAGFAYVSPGYV